MIDLHCHIDLYDDPEKIVYECHKRGLKVLSVTTTPSAWEGTYALGKNNHCIITALGLHPQLAAIREQELYLFDKHLPETNFVGEIGLDGIPENKSFWDAQIRVFEHILQSCTNAGGRIMSIHSRRATKQVLKQLERHPNSGVPILHWFSGNFTELEIAINLGCWFSVGPMMCLSKNGRSLISRMPQNRILTETDGPFSVINDKHLKPWDVDIAIKSLSEIWSTSTNNTANILNQNFRSLINS